MSLINSMSSGLSAGLSAAGYAAGDYYAKSSLEDQRAQVESDRQARMIELTGNKEISVAGAKLKLQDTNADQQRLQQSSRIDAAAEKITAPQIEAKRGLINSGISDTSAWTPEQQAAVDQSMSLDKTKAIQDPSVRNQAAVMTGDIAPKDAASMASRVEINQLKMDSLLQRAEDKNATSEKLANIRADAMMASTQLRVDAANQRATNGKIDTATGRMLITSEDANIRASTSQLQMLNSQFKDMRPTKDGKPNPVYDDMASQMDDIRDSIKVSQDNKASYLKTMGLMKDPGEKVAPKAATTEPTAKPATTRPPLSSFGK
jgi:hypothetical protein